MNGRCSEGNSGGCLVWEAIRPSHQRSTACSQVRGLPLVAKARAFGLLFGTAKAMPSPFGVARTPRPSGWLERSFMEMAGIGIARTPYHMPYAGHTQEGAPI